MQFDKRLHQYQVIRFPISKKIRELNLMFSALIQYARQMDEHPELASSKLMAANAMGLKISSTELGFESAIHCFRTLGGRGFTRQYANEIGLLDPYCMLHGGGSNYVLEDSESRRFFKYKPTRREEEDVIPKIDY
ncbi:MAG: acyl-CoA dehydrogenase family protein [Candidatus Hodarchaeales archaeon]|jgi:alkylation response protein AidB-like acyl-CoA dehydrogenase